MKYNNLDTSKLKYIIYCRKSSEGEDKQIQSLDTQLRELNEHAEKNGLEIIETISESKSAHTTGRSGFNKMMDLIRTGKANAILVIRANRISRNPIDAGYVISLMDEKKLLYIRTPNSTCYTSSSADKMMIALELIFSKKDSDDKGDMVKEGQKTKALKGIPHGVATLGFINDKTEEKGNRKWLVDEERYWKIKQLLEMFLTGTWSAGKLYKYAVNDLKLNTVTRRRTGGAPISLSRIYTILTDPVYAGFFYQGGERYDLDINLPRMIIEEEHEKIKRLLSRNNIPKTQKHETAYEGIINTDKGHYMGADPKYQVICDCKFKFAYRDKTHCPNCEIKIDQMENPKYLYKNYYYDVKSKKNGIKMPSIEESKINSIIKSEVISNLSFSNDLLSWSRKYIHELKDKEISEKVLKAKDKEIRKAEFENKKSKLRVLLRDERITQEEYNYDLDRLKIDYSDLDETTTQTNWYEEMLNITNITETLIERVEKGSVKSKKGLFTDLGTNLVWNGEILSVYNKKSIQTLINGIKSIKSEYEKSEPKITLDLQSLNEKTDLFKPVFSKMLRE